METDTMAEKMKASLSVALTALAFGAMVAGGLYWILPTLPWWAYVIVALPFAGVAYKDWREMTAHKKIIDRGDRSKRPGPPATKMLRQMRDERLVERERRWHENGSDD